MKLGSTFVLRTVIVLMALAVVALCTLGLPQLILVELSGDFDYGVIFVAMYISAVPFFIALRQAWKLLNYIDTNKVFSVTSVMALSKIKYAAFIISAFYTAGMPYIFYIAQQDDAPGVALIGFVIIGASFVIGTAAAVFQQLLQNVLDIKSENELTV